MKVKVFKLKNGQRDEIIDQFSFKPQKDFCCFDIIKEIENRQNSIDFLGIGKIASTGICAIESKAFVYDSYAIDGEVDKIFTGKNSFVIGKVKRNNPNERNKNVVVVRDGKNEETDIQISFTAYDNGIVLHTGQKITTWIAREDAYISKFTAKKVVQGPKSGAKLFASYKDLLKFIQKNELKMIYTVEQLGFNYSVVSINEGASDKSNKELIDKVEAKLEIINSTSSPDEDDEDYNETGIRSFEETKKECIARMEKLKMMRSVISGFAKNNKIYMSDLDRGILFDCNKEAEKGIELFKKEHENKIPYHVIAHPIGGEMTYTILYASMDASNWQGEKPDKEGNMYAAVYMPWCDMLEFGTVGIESANGGLVRTL